jgi:uncharacterized protein YyaL (SSP411 family)
MLYTQAELIPLYVKAYLRTKKDLYKKVVIETINMVEDRFVDRGLFYSASDTDSDGIEGGYFLFSAKEIQKALKSNSHATKIKEIIEFTKDGNFNGKTTINIFLDRRPKGFECFVNELKKIRKNKTYPFIDKKINTAWNAMMIKALYEASILDKSYTKKANEHLEKLRDFMFERGELYHQSLIGIKPKQLGLLEDYSFFISALIAGYESDYDESKINFAYYLFEKAKEKFYKNGRWSLSDSGFIVEADLNDKYYTSALGEMLQNIFNLASLKASHKYLKVGEESLKHIIKKISIKQDSAPASAQAFLMDKIGVVILKSSKSNLIDKALEIKNTKYPYLLTKKENYDNYLACTINSCFSIDKNLSKVKKDIEDIGFNPK